MENRIYNRHRPSIMDTYDKRNVRISPNISPEITHIPAPTENVPEMGLDAAKNEIVIPNPLFQEEVIIQIDNTVINEHHK
jgi:hypothetical protein